MIIPARHGSARAVWRTTAGLAAVLALALAVRLVHLATDPIWYDEAATIGIASMAWQVILGPMAAAESSPPGYYIAAKLWSAVWGDSIWSLRMLSVLAGVSAIVPVFLMARAAFGPPAAWIASLFIALSASHVRFSQDARCYTLLFLVAALAMLAATRLAMRQPTACAARTDVAAAVALGSLMGIGLWLHATAGLIVVSLNLFVIVLLAHDRANLRRGLLLLAAADLLMLAIAAAPVWAVLEHLGADDGYVDRWILPPGIIDAARLYGRTLVAPFLWSLSPLAAILQLLLIGAATLAWWRHRNPMLPALAVMLAAAMVLLPLISQFRPVLLDRTALFMLLPLALLLAAGASSLEHLLSSRRVPTGHVPTGHVSTGHVSTGQVSTGLITLTVAAPLLVLQAIGVVGWHRVETRKEGWDQTAALLKARMLPGEPIVLPDSSFVSISLARHLTRIGSAVPRMIAVPPVSELEQLVAQQLLPSFLRDTAEPCSSLGAPSLSAPVTGLWLVMRDQPSSVANDDSFSKRGAVRDALLRGGAVLRETFRQPSIEVEYWTAPRC